MQVITLAKTKELLGITGTASDAAITAKLPIIDAKVKLATKNTYNYKFGGDTTSGSAFVSVYELVSDFYTNSIYRSFRPWSDWNAVSGINNPFVYSDISEFLEPGQLVDGDNIPADSYIVDITSNGTTVAISGTDYFVTFIELSAEATATESGSILTGGISIGYQDIIAKGIQYLIESTSTTLPGTGLASRSVGPLSVSFSTKSQKKDGKYGMPSWFSEGLPRFQRGL